MGTIAGTTWLIVVLDGRPAKCCWSALAHAKLCMWEEGKKWKGVSLSV